MAEPSGGDVIDVTLDPASPAAEQATNDAIALITARVRDPESYARELERVVRATVIGVKLSEPAGVRELASRVAMLVEGLAAVGSTASHYAADKLGVPSEDLIRAVAKALADVRANVKGTGR